jgi:hypothetical protein
MKGVDVINIPDKLRNNISIQPKNFNPCALSKLKVDGNLPWILTRHPNSFIMFMVDPLSAAMVPRPWIEAICSSGNATFRIRAAIGQLSEKIQTSTE